MKINWTYKFGLLIIGLSFLMMSCGSAKFAAGYKSQKKQIDTLSLILPFSTVLSLSFRTGYMDTLLTHFNQQLIEKSAIDLLSTRYVVEKAYLSEINLQLLDEIYFKVENSSKTLDRISSELLLEKLEQNNNLSST